jgi:hypothetical protein
MEILNDINNHINIVTALMALIFILPVFIGIIRPLNGERIQRSFSSLLNNIIFLVAILLSIYLARILFTSTDNIVLNTLYSIFPSLQSTLAGKEIWIYILCVVLMILAIYGILYLITMPLYRFVVVPMSSKFAAAISRMHGFFRRLLGGLWQLPRSIWLVLVFCLLLNFYTDFFGSSFVSQTASSSAPYQLMQEKVIQPIMNNSVVKNIQILLSDTFIAEDSDTDGSTNKIRLIRYINGMTLDEAVKADDTIDAAAKKITASGNSAKEKGRLLYRWISKNIVYDNAKAAAITSDPSKVKSGAVVAYHTKKGICFDYSCLFVAMCRTVGLKVRFITGLGYTGTTWGDHAWNQVYDSSKKAWINVDTTFGSSGINYYGRSGFNLDHQNAVVQGEW